MFKYNMNKFYFKSISAYVITVTVCAVLTYIIFSEYDSLIKMIIGCTAVFLFWIIKHSGKFANSYIEFKEDEVLFKSFYISSEADDYLIDYKDIVEITASLSFWGKITDVYIKTKNYDGSFEIDSNFENYVMLYDQMCKTVKTKNPDVKIDERIYEFINKKL